MLSLEQAQDLLHLFTYHAPTEEQKVAYAEIRAAGMILARTIAEHAPSCPDQSAAIRKVREAVMTANAAIATNGGRAQPTVPA